MQTEIDRTEKKNIYSQQLLASHWQTKLNKTEKKKSEVYNYNI